jgi:hypothetical protein
MGSSGMSRLAAPLLKVQSGVQPLRGSHLYVRAMGLSCLPWMVLILVLRPLSLSKPVNHSVYTGAKGCTLELNPTPSSAQAVPLWPLWCCLEP